MAKETRQLLRDQGISTEDSLADLMTDLMKRLLVRIGLNSCLIYVWSCVVLEDQLSRINEASVCRIRGELKIFGVVGGIETTTPSICK